MFHQGKFFNTIYQKKGLHIFPLAIEIHGICISLCSLQFDILIFPLAFSMTNENN